jgi:murein DD-endopeptidase MepM/ murein hydrolase activator NlpD
MKDAYINGAAAGTSLDLKRRTPLLVLITVFLIFGGVFTPLPAYASQTKASVSKASAKKNSQKKTASKKCRRVPYVRSLMPAEEKAALLDRGFSSGFGVRAVSRNSTRMHNGIDVPAPKGSPIMAFNDGVVTFAGVRNGYGKTVIIKQLDGREALYAHMDKYVVNVGDAIKRGTHIGHVGRTGRATGFHLHFELIDDGQNIDPAEHVWHSAELVLGPGELNPATDPDSSVAQQNKTPKATIY